MIISLAVGPGPNSLSYVCRMNGRHVFAIWILLSFVSMAAMAQQKAFTGKIRYENTYQSTDADLPLLLLRKSLGESSTLYLYKGGYCKEQNQPLGWEKQWFDIKENRLHFIQTGFDTLFWTDPGSLNDSIPDYEIIQNAAEVLGHSCHVLTFQTEDRVMRYFYSPDFFLPGDSGSHYRSEIPRWIQTIIQAPCLRIENESRGGKVLIVNQAVEIEARRRIPRKIRRLPRKMPRREWK